MKCVCEVNLYLSGSIDRGWVADPGFVWYFNVIVWFSAWRGLHVCSLNAAIHNWRDYILIYSCIGFNKSRLPVFYHRLKAWYCRLLSLWAGSCVWFSRLAFTQLSYEAAKRSCNESLSLPLVFELPLFINKRSFLTGQERYWRVLITFNFFPLGRWFPGGNGSLWAL